MLICTTYCACFVFCVIKCERAAGWVSEGQPARWRWTADWFLGTLSLRCTLPRTGAGPRYPVPARPRRSADMRTAVFLPALLALTAAAPAPQGTAQRHTVLCFINRLSRYSDNIIVTDMTFILVRAGGPFRGGVGGAGQHQQRGWRGPTSGDRRQAIFLLLGPPGSLRRLWRFPGFRPVPRAPQQVTRLYLECIEAIAMFPCCAGPIVPDSKDCSIIRNESSPSISR